MKFRFSAKVTIIGSVLICGMLRASYWQWNRHLEKQAYIATLDQRLEQPIEPIEVLEPAISTNPEGVLHRRVRVAGTYDFEHEVLLRNRRYEEMPGAYVITPLKLEGQDKYILVNRGFVPLSKSSPEQRKEFRKSLQTDAANSDPRYAKFVGLLKLTSKRKFLGPHDPEAGPGNPWIDAWLWFDIDAMQKQLPYPLLPMSLEIIGEDSIQNIKTKMISAKSGRDDMFMLSEESREIQSPETIKNIQYPPPVFDIVTPPGRHLGYVFEWAFMALGTLLICLVLQLRRVG